MTQRIEVELDDRGRVLFPAQLRRKLKLEEGNTLIVEERTPDDAVYLRVDRSAAPIVEREGVLVINAQPTAAVDDAVAADREQRIEAIAAPPVTP